MLQKSLIVKDRASLISVWEIALTALFTILENMSERSLKNTRPEECLFPTLSPVPPADIEFS